MSKRWPQSGQAKATTSPGRKPSSSGTAGEPAGGGAALDAGDGLGHFHGPSVRPAARRREGPGVATYTPGVLPVLVLRHDADAGPGYLGDALAAAGLEMRVVDPAAGEALPGLDGVVGRGVAGRAHGGLRGRGLPLAGGGEAPAGGGRGGRRARRWASAWAARSWPTPSGGGPTSGRAARSAWCSLELTAAGRSDPVVRHLDGPVAVSHADTWDLPPGATLLAQSDRYRHAFRLGLGPGPAAPPRGGPGGLRPVDALQAAGRTGPRRHRPGGRHRRGAGRGRRRSGPWRPASSGPGRPRVGLAVGRARGYGRPMTQVAPEREPGRWRPRSASSTSPWAGTRSKRSWPWRRGRRPAARP